MSEPERCPFVAPVGHDFAHSRCGLLKGHRGNHTALISGEFLGAAAPLSMEGATADKIAASCMRLAQLVWALGIWNDHNWTHADYTRWREEARTEAKHAETLLAARSPSDQGER